jgi:hypothetical protein
LASMANVAAMPGIVKQRETIVSIIFSRNSFRQE